MLETIVATYLLPLAATAATPVILYLAHRLIKWLEKKTEADISEKDEQRFDQIVRDGIAFAEQIAAAKLKQSGEATGSSVKRGNATSYIGEQIERAGAQRSEKEIQDAIEARLGRSKFPNII